MSAAVVAVAFTAGILSFLSPCIVPMLTVYFSLITGQSAESLQSLSATGALRGKIVRATLAFTLGFTLVFTAAGAAAARIGSLFQESLGVLNLVGGGFVLVLGLIALGVVPRTLLSRVTLRHRDLKKTPGGPSILTAFLVGLFFAVACSHCIAPTLYSVLLYAGGTGSPTAGALLMFAFSAGLAIPYVLTGLFYHQAIRLLKRTPKFRRAAQWAAGALMVLLGIAMMSGNLGVLTGWLQKLWPYRPPIGM